MNKAFPWGLAAVLVVATLVLPAAFSTPHVSAVESPTVEVLIDHVAPTRAGTKSVLRIKGRVANTSENSVDAPVVQLRLSPEPLTGRGEVASVIDGTTGREGLLVTGTASPLGSSLEPGQQLEFEIATPMSELELSDEAAVYALFVEALDGSASAGRAGVLIPWFPKGSEYRASKLALTWPMTQRPALAEGNLVLDAALPQEFDANGRLARMLDVGESADVSWLVDSATVETATQLAEGYQLQTASGPKPGDQSEEAERFGKRLAGTLAAKQVALPGYAFADADALLRSGLTSFVVRSASLPRVIGEAGLEQSDIDEVFVAPGGFTSAQTLRVLVDAGVRNVILSDAAFPPSPELNYTPTGALTIEAAGRSLNVLLSDPRLSEVLARDLTTTENRNSVRQEFLAELAMITLERPNEPRRIVALPPELWNPPKDWAENLLSAITAVPWIDVIQLDEVNRGTLVDRAPASYGKKQRRQELPKSYVQEIASVQDQLDSFAKIVDDPAGFGEGFALALQRAGSSLWRDDKAGRDRMISTISKQLNDERQKVRVVSAGNVTLAGDNGILPLTIANDLDRDVTVGIELQTENQTRLLYEPPAPVTVSASQKAGLEVPIKVVGSQPMEVTVLLTDKSGHVFDASAKLQVQSTASTRVAAVVIGVGALGFLILVGLRVIRRRRGD